jgi:hypothetical protein
MSDHVLELLKRGHAHERARLGGEHGDDGADEVVDGLGTHSIDLGDDYTQMELQGKYNAQVLCSHALDASLGGDAEQTGVWGVRDQAVQSGLEILGVSRQIQTCHDTTVGICVHTYVEYI